jgi:hypothetical protein
VNTLKSFLGLGRRSSRRDPWRVAGAAPRGSDSGVDFSDAWTLPEGGVAWLRTTTPGEVLFRGRAAYGLEPGAFYRFSLLAAVHRCRAELVLEVQDSSGVAIQSLQRGISTDARGGRERGAYDAVEIVFRAPAGAARLVATIRKGGGGSGQDSFLFVAEPALNLVDETSGVREALGPSVVGPVAAPPHVAAQPFNRRHDADARRMAAARNWLARPASTIPDLDALSAVLDAGVTGRTDLPRLAFPIAAQRQATILLAAGDEAELLWLSLAGLLAAANAADFEVCVVASATLDAGAIEALVSGVSVLSKAAPAGHAGHVVLMQPGFEPVAGWLDELLAALRNFEAVAAAPKLIEANGFTPDGDNPRDPRVNFVRPVARAFPLMVSRDVLGEAADVVGLAEQAHARLRERGEPILYCPTAEFVGLQGAPPRSLATTPFAAAPVPDPAFRVLFIDQEAPTVDMDAGGYAAFQEMRMLQALGGKVDFLPKNLAWMDRHTLALERAGVECHYTPFARHFDQFLQENAGGYDLIFVLRYKIAALVQSAIRDLPRRPRIVLNLADLHFLRELREVAAGTPGFDMERARTTQTAELAAIASADLTLTYSDIEAGVITHHHGDAAKLALAPWTVESRAAPPGIVGRSGMMFLGGFGHPPNAEAVKAFASDVMPRLAAPLPGAMLRIVGSKPTPAVLALAGPRVEVLGYVADLDEVFDRTRVFVAPLIAGAGLKGKVIEALARGVPMVLSPIAAEGTGLVDGVHCLIARSPQEQAEAIVRLYADGDLWRRIAEASLAVARERFSFDGAVETMRAALRMIGVETPRGLRFHYRRALPDPNRGASSAPAVLRLP